MGDFNPAVFQLSRIIVWSIVYGLYAVLSSVSLYLLLRYGSAYSGRTVVVLYTLFMSVVVTGWYAMSVGLAVQTLEGTLDDTGCSSLCVPQAVFVVLECLGGDALLLYRVIVIWKRDLRVAIPLSIAYAALSGFGITSYTIRENGLLINVNINSFYIAYMCIFLVFNIIVPALMALKLWKTTRDEARGTASSVHVRGTLRLLLQTALVWAIAATAFITSQLDNTTSLPVAQVIRDSVQELVVLVPAAIIFDIALRECRESAAAQAGRKKALSLIRMRALSPLAPAESPFTYGSSVGKHACADHV